MNKSFLKHLNDIYSTPLTAWRDIDRESYKSKWDIIKDNLQIFLIINPLLFSIFNIWKYSGWKSFVNNAVLYPVLFTIISILFILLASLLLEEAYRITSHRDPEQSILKLLVFSSLPFFTVIGLKEIPLFGPIFFVTGLVYSFYLLKTGFDKYIWVYKSTRRSMFFISSILILCACFGAMGALFYISKFFVKIILRIL